MPPHGRCCALARLKKPPLTVAGTRTGAGIQSKRSFVDEQLAIPNKSAGGETELVSPSTKDTARRSASIDRAWIVLPDLADKEWILWTPRRGSNGFAREIFHARLVASFC